MTSGMLAQCGHTSPDEGQELMKEMEERCGATDESQAPLL